MMSSVIPEHVKKKFFLSYRYASGRDVSILGEKKKLVVYITITLYMSHC